MNAEMARVAKCNKVGRIVVGVDIPTAFLPARSISMMDAQAAGSRATEQALRTVTFNNAAKWGRGAFFGFKGTGFFHAVYTFGMAGINWVLSTLWTQAFSKAFLTSRFRISCVSFYAGLAARSPINGWVLAAGAAKPRSLEEIISDMIAVADSSETTFATHLARRDVVRAASNANACLMQLLGVYNGSVFSFVRTLLTVLESIDWRALSTSSTEAITLKAYKSIMSIFGNVSHANCTAYMSWLNRSMPTSNAKSLSLELGSLFLGITHGQPPCGDYDDYIIPFGLMQI